MPYKDPEKEQEYQREYRQRSEVKEARRKRDNNLQKQEKKREYHREYMKRPGNKELRNARIRKINQRPEAKARRNQSLMERAMRWNAATKGRKNHSKLWTEQEIAILWDTNYTTKELASILQRTFCAIHAARRRYASRKPADYIHNGNRKISHEIITKG